jgi:hypothetical protein
LIEGQGGLSYVEKLGFQEIGGTAEERKHVERNGN